MSIEDMHDTPIDLLHLAGEVTELVVSGSSTEIGRYRRKGAEEAKGTQDLVTAADRRIEAFLVRGLVALLPGSSARGEEGRTQGGTDSRFEWVIDPIDGTINFARGCEFYTSVVALLDNGAPLISVTYHPESKYAVVATRGTGCMRITFADDKPTQKLLRVQPRDLDQSLFSIMITPKLSETARASSLQFAARTLDTSLGFRVLVSQAYEATKLAEGAINGVVSFQSSGGWTRDAARLTCEEAGGVFALLDSSAPTGERGFVLTDSNELLEELSRIVESVGYRLYVP